MNRFVFSLITLVLIFFTHHFSTYLHEWSHGLAAWCFGYKQNPFDISYGTDWIWLSDISENVDYLQMGALEKSVVAIVPTLVGALLFLVSLRALSLSKCRWQYSFWYWFALMNLGQVWDYVPIRTFSAEGDIANFLQASQLSPWAVLVPGSLFTLGGMYLFLWRISPKAFKVMQIHRSWSQQVMFFIILIIFFGYFGGVGFTQTDEVSHHLSLVSWLMIPFGFVLIRLFKRLSRA